MGKSDPNMAIALGQAESVDAIDVILPDGTTDTFAGQDVDRLITLQKGGSLK